MYTLSFKDQLEKYNSYRRVFTNIILERGVLSASFQLCLASSHVISLTCVPCLVLINILLKRVKRSSRFTSAKTRGHLVALVSIDDIFSKPPSNRPLCYWSEMFLKHRDTKNIQSLSTPRHTELLHLTTQLRSYVSLKLVWWELAGQTTERQSPSWDTISTVFPSACP